MLSLRAVDDPELLETSVYKHVGRFGELRHLVRAPAMIMQAPAPFGD